MMKMCMCIVAQQEYKSIVKCMATRATKQSGIGNHDLVQNSSIVQAVLTNNGAMLMTSIIDFNVVLSPRT